MTKLVSAPALALGSILLAGPALAADCGRISIAEMNWASAGIAAWVDKIVLENAYGCQVDLVTGDTTPTFTSMNEKGEPDIAPELWINSVKELLDVAVAEDRMVIAAEILTDGGVEGWWIPKYIADAHPDIKTVPDALKHPELFPAPEHPERGAVMNCPEGFACRISTTNMYRALGAADAGFDLVDTGSAAGLDGSIANAYERQQGWLGYYWSPTAILGKYEMVKLPMGSQLDMDHFNSCTVVIDCPDPKVVEYPVAKVFTVVTRQLADENAVVMDYLGRRSWPNDLVNVLLAWQNDNQATNEDAAWHFLENWPDAWAGWLDDAARDKVAGAL